MAADALDGALDQRFKEIIELARPMLAELPRLVEFSPYLEYKDNEVPTCKYCNNVCEIAYFKLLQFNTLGPELCGNCLDEHKMKTNPWTLHVREGVIHYLSVLNARIAKPTSSQAPVGLKINSSNGGQIPISAPLPPSTN